MGKHAYLIMAHNDFETLKYLLSALDDDRNDIYLHVDKKTENVDFEQISSWVKKAGLYIAPRHKIFWGHISIVKCELLLLKMATAKEHYDYYHLLSGADFPLKSQDFIHEFFKDKCLQYVTYYHDGDDGREFLSKIKYYYPFMRWLGNKDLNGPGLEYKILRNLNYRFHIFLDYQKAKGFDRTRKHSDVVFVKGDQWFSITDDFARYILANKKKIINTYRFTDGPDEFFVPTLAYNSEYKSQIADEVIRKIDWNRGRPYEFVKDDLEELKEAQEFFARKISYAHQPELVKSLYEYINN